MYFMYNMVYFVRHWPFWWCISCSTSMSCVQTVCNLSKHMHVNNRRRQYCRLTLYNIITCWFNIKSMLLSDEFILSSINYEILPAKTSFNIYVACFYLASSFLRCFPCMVVNTIYTMYDTNFGNNNDINS